MADGGKFKIEPQCAANQMRTMLGRRVHHTDAVPPISVAKGRYHRVANVHRLIATAHRLLVIAASSRTNTALARAARASTAEERTATARATTRQSAAAGPRNSGAHRAEARHAKQATKPQYASLKTAS